MLSHFNQQRLATVNSFFQAKDNTDLLGCYVWAQAVSSGLLPILGDFEVTLRNALHRSLSLHYSNPAVDSFDWMMQRPNPVPNPAKPFISAHHSMSISSQKNIEEVLRKKPRATPDDVVASLSFGFWEKLIDALGSPLSPQKIPNVVV